jgi:beta-lactamase regulating signal transducer with metallopeptidase domain
MENLLLYFAKVNGLIILFYLMYVLFLRKETFFVSNRWYFIIGLLLSLVLPLITFTKTIWVEPAPVAEFYQETTSVNSDLIAIPIQENPIDWTIILLSAYVIISIAIILKIGVELASFFKRIQKQNKQKGSEYTLINSNSIENPFSFFSYIIINKNMFTEEEIEHILTHESVHVKQKHSIDVLIGKLFCALFWVNPIIWLYRKAMLQNLEFIADNETFQQIENKYEYQKTLLKVVTHQHDLSITNQFYQSLIKKRIVMLHTNQSHKKNVWKYATILPLLVSFMLLFQIETVAQVKENSKVATYAVSSNFSSILTKNTTDKELRELEKSFSDEKYKLKISKVKRNKEGEIIGIKLSFDSGKTYNQILERKSTEPIDDIRIYINFDKDDNQTCGFEEIKNTEGINWNDAKSLSSVEIKKSATDETIYIINGKEYTKEEMKDKIVELDGAIEMNEDKKSGKKIMLFKGKSNISDEPKTTISFDEIAKKKESEKPNSEAVYAVLVEAEYSEDETISNIDKIKREKLVDAKKALIFFNGKEINYEDLDKIDPKTISSFGNTIASHAIKKYGEKGKNGVIFINTKAYDIENNPAVAEYLNLKKKSEKPKPKTIELKNGDVVVVFDGDKIKFPGYPMQYLNQLKLELQGKILEDNIDFFKNYEFEKIKDLIIIEDGISSKEKKRIKKIIIETK